jgi:hypothetical protein
MSQTLSVTVAASPSAVESATGLLAQMAALSGGATDYNIGSQIRTLAEAQGAALEQQGIGSQALALQALAYGAMSLFGIGQPQALNASGVVTFATSLPLSGAPNVPQAVLIPSGTLVGTAGGVQFAVPSGVVLASGTSAVNAAVICTAAGPNGNVPASGISSVLTSIGWPLVVVNANATAGGAAAGSYSSALALFTAKVASLGLCTPVAVPNAVIGVSGIAGEYVAFAANYEPWLAAGSGAGSGTAGFTLYVDNGSGSASSTLLANVRAYLNGSVSQNQPGARPDGVPCVVSGVTPVYATVTVSGTLIPGTLASGTVQAAVTSGVTTYFNNLNFAPNAAQQAQIAGAAADAGLGSFQSLSVSLYYSGGGSPVAVVSGTVGTRVILAGLTVTIGPGT